VACWLVDRLSEMHADWLAGGWGGFATEWQDGHRISP